MARGRLTGGFMARRSWPAPMVIVALAGSALGQGLEPGEGDRPAGLPPPVLTPPAAPAAQPGAAPANDPLVTLADFSEPVELTALVEYVATTLNVNMLIKGTLTGSVVFNAPVSVPRGRLLTLLDSLLEQQNYAVTLDSGTGFYHVVPQSEVAVSLTGEQPTTRVFTTPNIRPSQLKPVIDAQFGGPAAAAPGMQGGGGGRQIAYIDELGVIIATESPRRLEKIESLITALRDSWAENRFIRIDLNHVAAPVARERALQLIGQEPQQSGAAAAAMMNIGQPVQGMPGQPAGRTAFDNLGDRLTIDPNGNALIFRGRPEEETQVRSILAAIDVKNQLAYKKYFAGSAARRVADLAQKRGLGEIVQIQDARSRGQSPYGPFFDPSQQQPPQEGQSLAGGPVMVVDERAGELIYYATEQMHAQLDALIKEIDPKQEVPIIRTYKLKNARAEKVADVILAIVENRPPVGEAPLLPDGSRAPAPQPTRGTPSISYDMFGNPTITGDGISIAADENFYVVADQSNNQLLVKAPGRQQEELAKLIGKLDLRRPQVYVEARIVAVSWSKEMRLAFESQLINAGGTGGVLNTNFGLGGFGEGGALTGSKSVATGLTGLTAAIIKSDQVPIIMHALARNTDARIVSSPAVLVDDNEEAEIASVEEQPTSTTTQSTGNPAQTSFGGYQEAGSSLKITPQISESNYLRMKIEAELSSFTGVATANLPPPRQRNNIKTESLTVPSNSTVIIGGLNLTNRSKAIVKVPILGDIPLAGLLFRDTNKNNRETTLYVFVTPRILRDPAFADLHLLTEGPQAQAQLAPNLPPQAPAIIEPSDGPGSR
ncbi:MAG: hypothetical protein FJ255_03520 [Phycisphaerae bacterium]|nr:hypothetical protein [Phycisphaerae bacterium]